MKRTTIRRWTAAGALALAAVIGASIGAPDSQAVAEDFLAPAQLDAFFLVDQAPDFAVLNVVSGPQTAGSDCMIHVDGIPSASITLAPGSNLVFVPANPMSTFIAGGGEIEFRLAASVGSEEDPGGW